MSPSVTAAMGFATLKARVASPARITRMIVSTSGQPGSGHATSFAATASSSPRSKNRRHHPFTRSAACFRSAAARFHSPRENSTGLAGREERAGSDHSPLLTGPRPHPQAEGLPDGRPSFQNSGMRLSRRSPLLASGALALPATPSAQNARVPVRVGFVPVIGAAPLYVMTGAGWTREAGLDVVTTKFESGPPAIQALASGTLDVLFVGIAPIAVARSRGLPVKVVAASGIGGSGFAVQAALGAAFEQEGGEARSAFARFRRDTGRPAKIATLPPGGTPTVALRYWLKSRGVDPADLGIVSMGIDAVQGAMLTGAVDGGTVLEPGLTIVRERNPAIRTIAYATAMYPNLPGVVVAATEPFAAARPQAVQTLVALAIRARDLIRSDPAAAAPHVAAVLAGGLVATPVFERALRSEAIGFVVDPREIVAATADSLSFEVEIGDFATAPSIEGLFDPSWYVAATAR